MKRLGTFYALDIVFFGVIGLMALMFGGLYVGGKLEEKSTRESFLRQPLADLWVEYQKNSQRGMEFARNRGISIYTHDRVLGDTVDVIVQVKDEKRTDAAKRGLEALGMKIEEIRGYRIRALVPIHLFGTLLENSRDWHIDHIELPSVQG